MTVPVTTLRNNYKFASIRQICIQFGLEQEELEQYIVENAFPVYYHIRRTDHITITDYDSDGNERPLPRNMLPIKFSGHHLLDHDSAATIIQDGSLTSREDRLFTLNEARPHQYM